MLCVEFPQVYYIDLIEIVHALKAFAVATSEDLNLSAIFVVSQFLSATYVSLDGGSGWGSLNLRYIST